MKHVLREFTNTPWAILPSALDTMATVLHRWASGVKLSPEEIRAAIGNDPEIAAARRQEDARAPGAVAVLPLFGVVSNRIHQVQDISGPGGTSTEGFARDFRAAVNNPSIGSIVIDINSPGGSVYGVQELAQEIYQARGKKTVVAVANSLAASAAYWIGSAAGEFVAAPGADVGSIGVISMHQDWSDFVNKPETAHAVPKIEFITAGEHKAEGNPFEPLSDETRAFYQQRVDEYYDDFIKTVARNRGVTAKVVNESFGQGRVYGAKQAHSVGMIDDIDTLDNVIARLVSGKKTNARRNANRLAITERT